RTTRIASPAPAIATAIPPAGSSATCWMMRTVFAMRRILLDEQLLRRRLALGLDELLAAGLVDELGERVRAARQDLYVAGFAAEQEARAVLRRAELHVGCAAR